MSSSSSSYAACMQSLNPSLTHSLVLKLASDAAARQIDDSVAAVLLEKKCLKEETGHVPKAVAQEEARPQYVCSRCNGTTIRQVCCCNDVPTV